MKQQIYTLELLTPCFCAGANQAVAEIRAPAIRGQLRWWFRALGGTPSDENAVFGGVAGNALASSLIIRIGDLKPGPVWTPPHIDPNSPDSYVWHFASVSGKAPGSGRSSLGPRWTSAGATPAKTTFTVHILQRRPLAAALQSRFELALRCFLQLGAIGLRATRGLGAFICHEQPFTSSILTEIQAYGFASEHRTTPLATIDNIAREIGGLLKGTRKAENMKAERPSPFGSSSPRQTSAIYFRPVRSSVQAKDCQLVIFEAPHARVLDPKIAGMPRILSYSPTKLTRFNPSAGPRRY
jgi:hypothetical protein